jgi:aspartate/methionine/tyrosine aminotransferase
MLNTDIFSALPDYPFPRLRRLLAGIEPSNLYTENIPSHALDMSIGEPRHSPPDFIRKILDNSWLDYRRYPPTAGTEVFLQSVKRWLCRRFNLPEQWVADQLGVVPLNGTREGMFMTTLTLTGDFDKDYKGKILIPNPFYQCYAAAALVSRKEPFYVPALKETNFLPDYSSVPISVLRETLAVFICSPSNPHGAVADMEYWERLLNLANTYGFYIFSDECYSEIYNETPPCGVLEAAQKYGYDPNHIVAFYSLSKRSNVPGLRSGFAVTGKKTLEKIIKIRSYAGAPCPLPVLHASAALWDDENHVIANRAMYREKYKAANKIFADWPLYKKIEYGFYLWLHTGNGEKSAQYLWQNSGIRTLPGEYLSKTLSNQQDSLNPGHGYLRLALVEEMQHLESVLEAVKKILNCEKKL